MENSLKQRIIGAIVLIALAIIFLPTILKDKANSGTFESKIPAQPEELVNYRVDTQKIDELVADQQQTEKPRSDQQDSTDSLLKTVAKSEVKQSTKANQTTESTKIAKRKTKQTTSGDSQIVSEKDSKLVLPPEESKISQKYRDAAWVIQVASFSKESNAKKMVSKLKANNYKAYRRKVISGGQTVFRVFVGPYIEKDDAQKTLSSISILSESNAILKPFDPIKH